MLRNLIALGVVVAITSPALATPSLIGTTVNLEFRSYGTAGGFNGVTFDSAIVNAGVEFRIPEPELVDIDASSITLSQDCPTFCGSAVFGPTKFDEVILTLVGSGISIVNAQLLPGHGVLNMTQENVTFGSDFVSIMLADTGWDGPEVVTINLSLVPEPGTALLFACVLAELALCRRRLL